MEMANSRNYFDVEKEFFLIDSDNLQEAETRLYGYSVQESGIYENDNLTEAAVLGLDGCGAYIYVEAKDGKITIRQDFNGSYGIYCFQQGGYFALSNSFFRLLEYVKTRFPISLNRDYANHILSEDLVNNIAYSETPIQEITVLDKDAFIDIDIHSKTLTYKLLDYKVASVNLNSAEGMAILDRWFLRWTNIFKKLKEKTDQITIDLSGGFDSRIIFLLMLKSGINLDEIRVNSINDTLHTHKEDYEIASGIAQHYGFSLNNNVFQQSSLPYSLEDILNICFYTKMCFHKEMYFKYSKNEWKRYRIAGSGGETIRAYWDMSAQEFRDKICRTTRKYSQDIQHDMEESIHRLLESSYDTLKKKYRIDDDNSMDYPMYMYREIRNREHFGKASVENYFSNTYDLTPYIDPALLRLRLNDSECLDKNLLMAVIYVRYCPQLLDFKFEGGRLIDPATVEFARKISKKYGGGVYGEAEEDREFHVIERDAEITRLKADNVNTYISGSIMEEYFKSVFNSIGVQKLFATCFDEEIYRHANIFFENNAYHPMRYFYSVVAITRVIEDVIASRGVLSPVQSMDKIICENYYEADSDREIIERLNDYITARIDFKLYGNNTDLEIISVSDGKARILKPQWFQKDGVGYVVESYRGSIELLFRSANGGNLKIWQRGRYVRDKEDKNIPYWISYQNVQYNGNIVTRAQNMACHDKSICLNYRVKAGDIIRFYAEWLPYRGDYGDIGRQEHKIKRLQKEIRDIKNSRTFRVGYIIMYIPGKIKGWFKELIRRNKK